MAKGGLVAMLWVCVGNYNEIRLVWEQRRRRDVWKPDVFIAVKEGFARFGGRQYG